MKDNIISLNAVSTEIYRDLLNDYFLPSIKQCSIPINIYDSSIYGDYFGKQFKQNIQFKIVKIIESLSNKPKNEIVIWTDVDIVFLKPLSKIIDNILTHMVGRDICASPENAERNYFNSGFLVIRCNDKNIKLFNKLLKVISETDTTTEQPDMNILIKNKFMNVNLFILPCEYWNMTVGIYSIDPYFIHANYIANYHVGKTCVDRKINAIKSLKKKFNEYIKLI